MPAAAALIVKINDGTTDVTYGVVSGSGGDKAPAYWRRTMAGQPVNTYPTFELRADWTKNRTARKSYGRAVFPITQEGSDGILRVVDYETLEFTHISPQAADYNGHLDITAQQCNLVAAVKAGLQMGWSYT